MQDLSTSATQFGPVLACGCSLMNGRCETHGAMMTEIAAAWKGTSRHWHDADGVFHSEHTPSTASPAALDLIWSLSDGYGEPGFIPSQGYDWSGIRDSSTTAIEAMFKAIHA